VRWTESGTGPLVVKLAGVAGGVALYEEECAAAAAAGFRIARVDTAGDRGDDPAPGRLTWDFLAVEVRRAIDALGGGPAILWGTSYGGLVALAAAARHPSKVAGLLLAVPPEPSCQPRLFPQALAWAESTGKPERAARALLPLSFVLFAGWELASPGLLLRGLSLARASAEAATPSRTVIEKLRLLWHDAPGLPQPGLWPLTSLIAGRRDLIAPHAGARKFAARMAGSRLVTIEDAGHGVAWTHAAAYHAAAVAELGRIARAAGL
jgi:pimeloyl-ACP methyl ester carboxylesterase